MEKAPVIIIGTGPEARIALDIFSGLDVIVMGLLATSTEEFQKGEINDVGIFAELDSEDAEKVLRDENSKYFLAVGDIQQRQALNIHLAELCKRPAANATHPHAWISTYAQLGFGNLFNAGVVINANAIVGDQNQLHSGVSVEPIAEIGSYCTLMSGVRIGANCLIEDEAFIGTGAIIFPGVKVGKGAKIGAGSVVLREVEPGKTVHGNPAMPI